MTHEVPEPVISRAEANAVTPHDVVDFFSAKGVKSECPCCGTDQWAFASPTPFKQGYTGLQLDEFPKQIGGSHMPVAVITCVNCGYVRMHALAQVAIWKREGGGK